MSLITNFWQYVTQKIRPYTNVDMNGKKISGLPTAGYPTENSDAATKKYVDDSGSPGIPVGVICMWSGIIADIPGGWALCDGGGDRPDLRSKFIRGAAGQDPGGTGGSDSIAIPNHSHTVVSHTHTGNTLEWHQMFTETGGHPPGGTRYYSINVGSSGTTSHKPIAWYGVTGGSAPGTNVKSFSTLDNRPAYYALAFIIKI